MIKEFFSNIHVKGTAIQVGEANSVIPCNDLDSFLFANQDKNLYFLAGVDPKIKDRAKDDHILKRRHIAFDFDIRKENKEITDEQIKQTGLEMAEKLEKSELFKEFSYIIFSGNGLHVYYCGATIDGDKEKFSQGMAYLIEEISKVTGHEADKACKNIGRIFRIPLSWNNKTPRKQTEFVLEKPRISPLLDKLYLFKLPEKEKPVYEKPKVVEGQNFWEAANSIDCHMALQRLSGTAAVRHERFTFKTRSSSTLHIFCNGEPANAWIDERGLIGGVGGSPTIVSWLLYYKWSEKEVAEIIKREFDDCLPKSASGVVPKMPIEIKAKSKSINSYTWGLDEIDEKITTPKKGVVTVLVADENAGKSTFCYFLARKNKQKYGHEVVYFNLEQPKSEVINGMAIQYSGLSKIQVRDEKHLTNSLYLKRKKELEDQEDIVFIGRRSNEITTIEMIRDEVMKLENIDYLIIDNLTCVSLKEKKSEAEEVKEIIQILIGLAEKMNIPIVLVHHYRKRQNNKSTQIFRDVHDMSGTRVIKDLVPLVIQVARGTDEDGDGNKNFHIREGKLRNGDKKEMITVVHDKGEFYPVKRKTTIQNMDFESIPDFI